MNEVKIKKVDVENLKAVSHFTAFFDGKSAHVTGANGHGKSTVIRALTDRLRGLKPEVITKIGEQEGKTTIELTDGCKFVWEYNDEGQDKLSYFAPNEFKPARREIFKSMCSQYFPNQFDINKFLTTTEPRKRLQMISELINVDLSEIQGRYKGVFETRRDAKRSLKLLEDQIMPKPDLKTFERIEDYCGEENIKVAEMQEGIDSLKSSIAVKREDLNTTYLKNKKANDLKERTHQENYQLKLDGWLELEESIELEVDEFNFSQQEKQNKLNERNSLLNSISRVCKDTIFEDCFDEKKALEIITAMPQPSELKTFTSTEKPEFEQLELSDPMPSADELNELTKELAERDILLLAANSELKAKELELSEINTSKQVYDLQVKQFAKHQAQINERYDYVQDCEAEVAEVLGEIKAIIGTANLPDDFSINLTDKNDILFRVTPDSEYLPITNETLASSAIFIAAFKLQANYLSAFKVAHFDVSYLDFENRKRVLSEAIEMGIQLITESPAMSVGEMELQYTITEE